MAQAIRFVYLLDTPKLGKMSVAAVVNSLLAMITHQNNIKLPIAGNRICVMTPFLKA